MRIVLEPAEAEVGEKCGTDGFVKPCCQTVVVNIGAATQAKHAAPGATQANPQAGAPCQTEISQRVAAKNVQIAGRLVVCAAIEGVLVEGAGTVSYKIVEQFCRVRTYRSRK